MPQLNGRGPDNKGSKTGRGLGMGTKLSDRERLEKLGVGMGKRRKANNCGSGNAKRLNGFK